MERTSMSDFQSCVFHCSFKRLLPKSKMFETVECILVKSALHVVTEKRQNSLSTFPQTNTGNCYLKNKISFPM